MARPAVIPALQYPQSQSNGAGAGGPRNNNNNNRIDNTTKSSSSSKEGRRTTTKKSPGRGTTTNSTENNDLKKISDNNRNNKKTTKTKTTERRDEEDHKEEGTDDEIGLIITKSTRTAAATTTGEKESSSSSKRSGRGRKATTQRYDNRDDDDDDDDDDELAQSPGAAPKKKPRISRTAAKKDTNKNSGGVKATTRGAGGGGRGARSATKQADGAITTRKRAREEEEEEQSSINKTSNPTTTSSTTIIKSNILRGPAKKKTVTFQDISDSDDDDSASPEPIAPVHKRRRTTAAAARPQNNSFAGLKAKPARKPRAGARGRKPAPKVLSPKRINQVARPPTPYVNSDGNDDEKQKGGGEGVVVGVGQSSHNNRSRSGGIENGSSPAKRIAITCDDLQSSATGRSSENSGTTVVLGSPVRRINSIFPATSIDENGNSPKQSIFIRSPAKRPPPFSYSFPRKLPLRGTGNYFSLSPEPDFDPDLRFSPLKVSPRKADLGASFLATPSVSQPDFKERSSPLKTSPRKADLGTSLMRTPERSSFSSSRVRLFQSPAKRFPSPLQKSPVSPIQKPSMTQETTNKNAKALELADREDANSAERRGGCEAQGDAYIGKEMALGGGDGDTSCADIRLNTNTHPEERSIMEPEVEERLQLGDDIGSQMDLDEAHQAPDEAPTEAVQAVVGAHSYSSADNMGGSPISPQEPHAEQRDDDVFIAPTTELLNTTVPEHDSHTSILDDEEGSVEFDFDDEPTLVAFAEDEVYMAIPGRPSLQPVIENHVPSPLPSMQHLSLQSPRQAEEVLPSIESAEPGDCNAMDQQADEVESAHPCEHEEAPDIEQYLHDLKAIQQPDSLPTLSRRHTNARKSKSLASVEGEQLRRGRPYSSPGYTGSFGRKSLGGFEGQPHMRRRSVLPAETAEEQPGRSQPRSISDDGSNTRAALHGHDDDCGSTESRKKRSGSTIGNWEIYCDGSDPHGDRITYPILPTESSVDDGGMKENDGNRAYSPVANPVLPDTNDRADEDKENKGEIHVSPPAPATPANVKSRRHLVHVSYTVSKVPLKPEGEVSPIKLPRQRGKSLSGVSHIRSSLRRRSNLHFAVEKNAPVWSFSQPLSPVKSVKFQGSDKRHLSSPSRRSSLVAVNQSRPEAGEVMHGGEEMTTREDHNREGGHAGGLGRILQGATVFVDVRTAEGEDASGVFITLLEVMGARCVKTWAWTPPSSSPVDGAKRNGNDCSKVSITHVIYKDGGIRTLEKVRQARGAVKCVGVGWVLECVFLPLSALV